VNPWLAAGCIIFALAVFTGIVLWILRAAIRRK
jgi:hypothetical protein